MNQRSVTALKDALALGRPIHIEGVPHKMWQVGRSLAVAVTTFLPNLSIEGFEELESDGVERGIELEDGTFMTVSVALAPEDDTSGAVRCLVFTAYRRKATIDRVVEALGCLPDDAAWLQLAVKPVTKRKPRRRRLEAGVSVGAGTDSLFWF